MCVLRQQPLFLSLLCLLLVSHRFVGHGNAFMQVVGYGIALFFCKYDRFRRGYHIYIYIERYINIEIILTVLHFGIVNAIVAYIYNGLE